MTRRLLALLDLAVCLLAAAAFQAARTGGFAIDIAGIRVSAGDPAGPLLQLVAVLAVRSLVRWRAGLGPSPVGGFVQRTRRLIDAARGVARSRTAVWAIVLSGLAGSMVVAAAPPTGLLGRYYTTAAGTGAPFLVVRDAEPGLARMRPEWFDTDYSINWSGVLHVERPGDYRFALESDDGSMLFVDGALVVDNGGTHSPIRAEGTETLQPGFHPIEIRYVQTVGGAALTAWWSAEAVPGASAGDRPFSEALLFPDAPSPRALTLFRVRQWITGTVAAVLLLASGLCLFAVVDALASRRRVALPGPPDWTAVARWLHAKRRAAGAAVGVAAIAAVAIAAGASFGRGLVGSYFTSADWTGTPFLTARDRRVSRERIIYDFTDPDGFTSAEWTGTVRITEPGEYRFTADAPGPIAIWIGGASVVDRLSRTEPQPDRPIRLGPGFHRIRVRYSDNREAPGSIRIEWSAAGRAPRPLGDLQLYPSEPARTPARRAWIGLADAARVASRWLIVGLVAFAGFSAVRRMREAVDGRRTHIAASAPRFTLESAVHLALLIAVAAVYVRASWVHSATFWGFAKMGRVPEIWSPGFVVGLVAVTAWMGLAVGDVLRVGLRWRPRASQVIATAAGSALVFWWWRSGFVNADGTSYRWMTPDILAGRFTRTLDEMWEAHLHAWFWQATHAMAGWSVRESYQVVSACAGGVFVAVALLYARRLADGRTLLLATLLLAGGYLQLFFGDVEHYTLVAVILLGYYAASLRFLQGRGSLVVPAALLGLAMMFHLLAGFALPSLAVLYVVAIRRRRFADAAVAAVAAVGVVLLTFIALGRPFASIWHDGLAGHAIRRLAGAVLSTGAPGDAPGAASGTWAFVAFDQYHWDQYNLLAVLFPAHLLILPLVAWRRVRLDAVNVHLLAAAAGMLFFHFNYRAMLPIDHDWNLFANAVVPLAILVWRNLLMADGLRWHPAFVTGWLVVSWVPTLAWVATNYRHTP